MATKFEKVGDGRYTIFVRLTDGRLRGISVDRKQVPNPSARGGAEKTEWHAYNRVVNLSKWGETRQEAYDNAIAELTKKGLL